MKKTFLRILLVSFAVALLLFSTVAFAHPGGTDKYGGHTERATGLYHYHHGHEAHQHPNGVCPFGDYDEWLKEHGVTARPLSEEPSNTGSAQSASSSDAWDEVGISLGAAGAAAIGYGIYRKNKKSKPAAVSSSGDEIYGTISEFDPNMIVYVANNGNRYHKIPGCCNAMLPMELKGAIDQGREPCPICCDAFMIEYANSITGESAETQALEAEGTEPESENDQPQNEQ